MKPYNTAEIRNLALIGQKGTGKTSLAEAMLFSAKVTTRLGRVEDGNTMLDFEPEEHKRVGSVQSAWAAFDWKKNKLNVLDTPGDPTFVVEMQNCLVAAETAVIVVSAADGVDTHTQRVFRRAEGKARLIVVNKMGRERTDFAHTLKEIKAKLISSAAPVTLPIGSEAAFKGVVDLLDLKAHLYKPGDQSPPSVQDVPAELKAEAEQARTALLEEIAGSDEQLMEKYLESGALSETEAREGLRKAILSGNLCPVVAVDATTNVGVCELMDLLIGSYPNPLQMPPPSATDAAGNRIEMTADMVAVVFKTLVDQHSGKMSMFKMLKGNLEKDMSLENVVKNSTERLSTLMALTGKKVDSIDRVPHGDIAAVAKLKATDTGDTLTSGKSKIFVKLPPMPPPQIGYRLIPKNKGDEDKISQAVQRLREEDPALALSYDELTKEMVLSGYGVAHIDVAIEKMTRKFGVQVDRATPNVPYRETISKPVKNVEGKHKKQSGGRGQFGVCYINMSPRKRGEGYNFVDSIFGGAIPRNFIPAVDKGIQEALARGVVAGYPVVDIEVELIDGKYHDVDSSELAFKIAGSKAFQAAAKSAGMIILEPIMNVEVSIPEENMGDVMGDINGRRGRVLGMDTQDGISTVKALVPMSEVLNYAPDLKSMTAGRGFFTMVMSHYDPVPAHLMDKIIQASPNKPHAEEEE
jgi:elongation factor G